MAQLRREQNGLKTSGLDVVLFGSGSREQDESFRHDYEVPFPIVSDPDCDLFKKYGLRDMDPRDWHSPICAGNHPGSRNTQRSSRGRVEGVLPLEKELS